MFTFLSNDDAKVFGIGLSRTGTTSLNKALSLLGYRSYHWRFSPDSRLLSLEDCYFCDAITDINASFMFEILAFTFPKAKFIYTTRTIDSWSSSISTHYRAPSPKDLKRQLLSTPVTSNLAPKHEKNTVLYHAIHHCLYTSHKTWADAYISHDQRVRLFFERQQERLLELDLFHGFDHWKRLCEFLNKEEPEIEFPHDMWKGGVPHDDD